MKTTTALILGALLSVACLYAAEPNKPLARTNATAEPVPSAAPRQHAFAEYVDFLKTQKQPPADYILNLFQSYDLVVLCERFHAEATQYDLIDQVVSDPRFQQQAGHIFTELGAASLQPYLESFLMDDKLTDEQVNEKLRYVARHFGYITVWQNTNFYDFLRRLYYLNRSLPKERRVHVYPTDLDFPAEATREGLLEFKKTQLDRRDEVEAKSVLSKFGEIRKAATRNKALVIMNYRHAFPHLREESGRRVQNTSGFLMKACPGKVANVMLNDVRRLPETTGARGACTAIQEGKWDAAFAVLGNPDLGFDFKGSPLGEDSFDDWPFPTRLRYQDVFTGFVFFKPLAAHRFAFGLPAGSVDQALADEILKRAVLQGWRAESEPPLTAAHFKKEFETIRVLDYSEFYKDGGGCSDQDEKIRQWLKATPAAK